MMNLEPIDTSTTAGKARVMQLAAEGRNVAYRSRVAGGDFVLDSKPGWDWVLYEYAILAEPVGPDDVWVVVYPEGGSNVFGVMGDAVDHARKVKAKAVRYRRADLAGRDE
jgi:hypothetical protein